MSKQQRQLLFLMTLVSKELSFSLDDVSRYLSLREFIRQLIANRFKKI